MSRTIDYYFSLASPWAYIGHAPVHGDRAAPRARGQPQADLPRARVRRDGRAAAAAAPSGAAALPARRAAALAREAGPRLQPAAEILAVRRHPRGPFRHRDHRRQQGSGPLPAPRLRRRSGRRSATSPTRSSSPSSPRRRVSTRPRSSQAARGDTDRGGLRASTSRTRSRPTCSARRPTSSTARCSGARTGSSSSTTRSTSGRAPYQPA